MADVTPAAPVPGLEPAFTVDARLGPLEDHGMTRAGHRRVIAVAGGRARFLPSDGGLSDGGPGNGGLAEAVDAEILPGGADWQVVRADGTIEIDTRYSAVTPTGEYVHFRTSGVRSGPPAVLAALLAGEQVDPAAYYFRVAVYLKTAAVRLSYLERSIFVASAVRGADSVAYTAYRVT